MAKKYNKYKKQTNYLNKRIKAILFAAILTVVSVLLFGGSIGSYSFEGYLPKIESYISEKSKPITESKQSNSGLYFSDGSSIPAYSGTQMIPINGDEPFFTIKEKNLINGSSFEEYVGNDYLGRAKGVFTLISPEDLISAEGRPELPDPVGWVGRREGGVYDRSHLKAYTFGGRNDVVNLITGTISLNQKYMVEVENTVRDYISTKHKPVLYKVTPYYLGDEKIPRGVLIEVLSSEGTIRMNRYIYNVQDGFSIDYKTGKVSEE